MRDGRTACRRKRIPRSAAKPEGGSTGRLRAGLLERLRLQLGLTALAASCAAAPAAAQTASPIGLGTIGGTTLSSALGVSSDGSSVVGNSYNLEQTGAIYGSQAFRWTSTTGMIGLGFLRGGSSDPYSIANAVNSDGSVVVGGSTGSNGYEAFRWTQAAGMVGLRYLTSASSGVSSQANGVNSDGTVVVGGSSYALYTGRGFRFYKTEAFRWTQTTGMVGLGFIGGGGNLVGYPYSTANAVSSDGSVVVGGSSNASNGYEAFRWTQASGMAGLGYVAGYTWSSVANALNSDGSVVVGSSAAATGTSQAFRWTQTTGTVGLGFIDGGGSQPSSAANAVNSDGSVVVGVSSNAANANEAFRWTQTAGMRSLGGLLTAAGVNMTGIALVSAQGISANGQIIVGAATGIAGSSYQQAYIVRYIDVPPSPASTSTPAPASTSTPAPSSTSTTTATASSAATSVSVQTASPVAGLTTANSVQNSIDQLGTAQNAALAQQQSLMTYLLYRGDAAGDSATAAGAFAEGGSAMGGVRGQINFGQGFSIFGGLAVGGEAYPSARVGASPWGALASRYVLQNSSSLRPFIETGGWLAPSAPFNFSRTYMNGAGTVTATGATTGSISYVYGRGGAVWSLSPTDEIDPALELGQARLSSLGYSETLSASNPFPASVSGSSTAMKIGKIEGTWTHKFTPAIYGSVYGAYARAWSNGSGVVASVDGVGTFRGASPSNLNWAEYGVQIGYRIQANLEIDGFVDGLTGHDGVGTKLHVGLGFGARF